MGKRSRNVSESTMQRWIKQGRGQGIGMDYVPWLKIQDVPSTGRASRIRGIKTDRIHHLLSDLETGYFYLLEYSDNVLDIRERFPLLPLEQTQDIAEELGIKHPADFQTKDDIIMTTDFLITLDYKGKPANIARTVLLSGELDKKRTLEKLEIERIYWEKNGVDWGIVTDKEINNNFLQNLKMLHQYHNINTCGEFEDISPELLNQGKNFLIKALDEKEPIINICHMCDKKLGLSVGSSIALFKHAVITKSLDIEITTELIDFSKPAIFKSTQLKKEGVIG